jgi:hypothetical protein
MARYNTAAWHWLLADSEPAAGRPIDRNPHQPPRMASRSPVLLLLLLLMLLRLPHPAAPSPVVHSDAPYVEIQPDRYTFQGLAPVAGWGIVPASCCVAQAISTREDTLLLMDSGELLLAHPQIQPGSPRPRRHFEHVRGARLVAGSRLIYDRDGVPVAVVDAASFRALSCELSSGVGLAPTCNVSAHATTPVDFGTIHGAVRAEPRQAPGAATTLSEATAVFVASERGLFRCAGTSGPPLHASARAAVHCTRVLGDQPTQQPIIAVAAHDGLVAAGGLDKFFFIDAATAAVTHWEWTTRDYGGGAVAGGVLDGAPRTIAFERASGDIYVRGTRSILALALLLLLFWSLRLLRWRFDRLARTAH